MPEKKRGSIFGMEIRPVSQRPLNSCFLPSLLAPKHPKTSTDVDSAGRCQPAYR
jgi:hypothetical protein